MSHGDARYEYLTITYKAHRMQPTTIGVLLWDKQGRRLRHSFRENWVKLIAENDLNAAVGMSQELAKTILESNGEEALRYCESKLVNIIRVSDRAPFSSDKEPEAVLDEIERKVFS